MYIAVACGTGKGLQPECAKRVGRDVAEQVHSRPKALGFNKDKQRTRRCHTRLSLAPNQLLPRASFIDHPAFGPAQTDDASAAIS